MKTNFSCKNIPPKANKLLLRCGIFIMLLLGSTSLVHAQFPWTNGGGWTTGTWDFNPCLITSPPDNYPRHWLLNLNGNDIDDTTIEVVPPVNDFGATYSSPSTGVAAFYLQSTASLPYVHLQIVIQSGDESNTFFKFGLSGRKSYSVNNGKLFYDTGHVNLESCDVIDLYYNTRGRGHYELRKGSVTLECGELENSLFGVTAFIKAKKRPNDNTGVFAQFHPIGQLYLERCVPNCSTGFFKREPKPSCTIIDDLSLTCLEERKAEEVQGYLTAYPNPASEQLTVSLNPPADEALTINIVDAMGKVVQYQQESVFGQADNTFQLNTSQLPSGIYYIMIDSAYRFEAQKVTIIK